MFPPVCYYGFGKFRNWSKYGNPKGVQFLISVLRERAQKGVKEPIYLDRFVRLENLNGSRCFDLSPPYTVPKSKNLNVTEENGKIKVELKDPPKPKNPQGNSAEISRILSQFYDPEDLNINPINPDLSYLDGSRPTLKASELPQQDLQYLVGIKLFKFFLSYVKHGFHFRNAC